ncbi:MAG: YihY/virulence factor BrkB family protein [Chloroflexota bacterium]|nr:YihY/virulence factor BrkB family protein [Chloroflexota bacterium]
MRLARQVLRDDVSGLAAELAYWFFLAIFPFLIFVAALSGFIADVFDVQNPTAQIAGVFSQIGPSSATDLLRRRLEAVVGTRQPDLLSVGFLGAIWIATRGTSSLIKAMNRAYGVEETRPFWQRNLLAVELTLVASSSLAIAFVVFFASQVLGGQMATALGLQGTLEALLNLLRWPVALALLLLASGFLYWQAPDVDRGWRWITPGALLFSTGWLAVTFLFAFYAANFGAYNVTYGTLGGVAVLLIWFYITAFLLLAGAELNAVVDQQADRRLAQRDEREGE